MKNLLFLIPLVPVVVLIAVAFTYAPDTKDRGTFGAITNIPVSTSVWVSTGADKSIVASSTGRQYLEISNVSGATSSPAQALYCNVNDAASVLYSGFVIHASSSKVFDASNPYTGAIHCRFPVAGGGVTVLEY